MKKKSKKLLLLQFTAIILLTILLCYVLMINNFPLSAVSISVALLGIMVNAFFTVQYVGYSPIPKIEEVKILINKSKVAKISNMLIVIGTVGHWFSVIYNIWN